MIAASCKRRCLLRRSNVERCRGGVRSTRRRANAITRLTKLNSCMHSMPTNAQVAACSRLVVRFSRLSAAWDMSESGRAVRKQRSCRPTVAEDANWSRQEPAKPHKLL